MTSGVICLPHDMQQYWPRICQLFEVMFGGHVRIEEGAWTDEEVQGMCVLRQPLGMCA